MTPYPFGSDGNPVDPNSDLCIGQNTNFGKPFGPGWQGEFSSSGSGLPGNPPCYLQATSFAFRAWNRGLAAVGQPVNNHDLSGSVALGVWLYNGSTWFPDPTFPGSQTCPGSAVLWAGKLDYWLVGSSSPAGSGPQQTLCRFDGTNLVWEPLSLPAATVARLPTNTFTGARVGGITSGACYAWNDCWFFGTDGIEVHWDGQTLADASIGLSTSPGLQDDFSAAAAGTDASGRVFGLAAAKSGATTGGALARGTPTPDGSPPTQLFTSQGGPFAPSTYSPPATDPFTADLTAASADSEGDAWVAADPVAWTDTSPNGLTSAQPAPLDRLSEDGARAPCVGYGATTFTLGPINNGYRWTGLTAVNDGSAFASARYLDSSQTFQVGPPLPPTSGDEPALVHAVCGRSPTVTEFRTPDPLNANQDPATATLVPADFGGYATAVSAPAPNDAWAATTDGTWPIGTAGGATIGGSQRPHLYQWTDGQPPDAPAGDDNEQRPSLFTLDAPVFLPAPPAVVVTPTVVTTTTATPNTTRTVKLKPAIYSVHSRLVRSRGGKKYTLYLTFKLRRPVTIGLQGLRKGKVVASTGLKHFTGHSGKLALRLDRKHWPTRLRLLMPKSGNKIVDAPNR